MVGTSTSTDGDAMRGGTGPHGFLWRAGSATPIDSPGGDPMRVELLNAHGQVAGESLIDGFRELRAFTWKDGKLVYLTETTAGGVTTAMNDKGQIAVVFGESGSGSVSLFDTAACFE